jgi:hypothetical protein
VGVVQIGGDIPRAAVDEEDRRAGHRGRVQRTGWKVEG